MSSSDPGHHAGDHRSSTDGDLARVAIVTLGCGRNEVDTDQLAGLLQQAGHPVVDEPTDAEVVLVNTCTFIAPAKRESIDVVLGACQLKDEGQARAVLVVGCMAQRYPDELAEAIPEADVIVGFDGYPRLPAIIEDALEGRIRTRVQGVGSADPVSRPLPSRQLPIMVAAGSNDASAAGPATQDDLDRVPASGPRFPVRVHDGRPWAYLKIASGCDRTCTFCAIPSFRGRFRSRPIDELVAEARFLVDNGARELVLVSENTTSWGKDLPGGRDEQPRLLESLGAIEGLELIRLMYLQPAELTDTLVRAMADHPKVADYFDLSLQHASGPVVRRMARSGDHERFLRLVADIRDRAPKAAFRSNFIVGFPGETDADVAVLEDFLGQAALDWVGLFAFSPEDGTAAHDLDDQVPHEVAIDRLRHLADMQEQIADAAARRFVGRRLTALVQRVDAGEPAVARSYREAPETDGEIMLVGEVGADPRVVEGQLVDVEVTGAQGVDLIGQLAPVGAGAGAGIGVGGRDG